MTTPQQEADALLQQDQAKRGRTAQECADHRRYAGLSLEEWDQSVRTHLRFIEDGAAMAARHAKQLTCRPGFHTYAQDELEKCHDALTKALYAIDDAMEAYRHKPTEAEHAARNRPAK